MGSVRKRGNLKEFSAVQIASHRKRNISQSALEEEVSPPGMASVKKRHVI